MDASKEYAFVIAKDSRASLNTGSFQMLVLNNHLSGAGSCKASTATECTDYPTGAPLNNACPTGTFTTDFSTSPCATRFASKTVVGRCTYLFGEGSLTSRTVTYYTDSTYATTSAARTICNASAAARYFTEN